MKKAFLSVLISVVIMLLIPYLIVELVPPENNALSTAPTVQEKNADG